MVIIFVALKDFIAIHTHTHTLMALIFFSLRKKMQTARNLLSFIYNLPSHVSDYHHSCILHLLYD